MSIIVKGMDMPKSCEECRLYVDKWCYAIDVESFTEENGTKATFICPLIEIPTPHGRLIAEGSVLDQIEDDHLYIQRQLKLFFSNAPTILEAEE